MGFNCLKTRATPSRQFTFYHYIPRNSWYSFYQHRKDESLSRPWSHPMNLTTGPRDWESSDLRTTTITVFLISNTVVPNPYSHSATFNPQSFAPLSLALIPFKICPSLIFKYFMSFKYVLVLIRQCVNSSSTGMF